MINFTLNDIRKTANDATFKKGLQYYQARQISDLTPDRNYIRSTVRGTKDYHVDISFDPETGTIGTYRCNCPAFNAYSGACKHIVASLFEILYAKEKLNSAIEIASNDHIIHAFAGIHMPTDKKNARYELNLDLQLEIFSTNYVYLLLRIGTDKLYIVKDFAALLQAMENHSSLNFGQKFTFTPGRHYFSELDQQVIDLLKNFYETYRFLKPSFYSSYEIQDNNRFYLPEYFFKQLCRILERKPFTIKYNQIEIMDSLIQTDYPFEFKVTEDDKNLLLHFPKFRELYPLTKDYEYVYYDRQVCRLKEEHRKTVKLILGNLGKSRDNLSFSKNSKPSFIRHVLPTLQKLGPVKLDEDFAESMINEPLKAKIYIDRYKYSIQGRLEFIYGDYSYGIYPQLDPQIPEGKILIRDEATEKIIMQEMLEAHCVPDESLKFFTIPEEAQLYDFVHSGLPRLQQLADVYYSDDFKQMSIRIPAYFKSTVRLNEHSDMLDFSFTIDDVDPHEMSHILMAMKEKRKYYRLKDGRFLDFEQSELHRISDLLQQVNVKEKDLVNGSIALPKYRAFVINDFLTTTSGLAMETNDSYNRLIQDIHEPGKMSFPLPKKIHATLRNYQKLGYRWFRMLCHYGFGGILADDMGLGKTLQAITVLKSSSTKKQSLVIAPTSLVYNWESEFQKFTPDLKVCAIHGSKKSREEFFQDFGKYQVFITSYGLLKRDLEYYMGYDFEYCFLDEAQHIKNPNSQNAKAVKQIKADHRFALTGTPIENSLTELWSIFDFIMPGYLSTHSRFIHQFEKPITKDSDQVAVERLTTMIKPFILRRLKTDVLKELPPKIESKVSTELSDKQKKIYLATLEKLKGEIQQELITPGRPKNPLKIITALTRLRQICCHPALFMENYTGDSSKLDLLEELVQDAVESGHRILIFSQFTSMLRLIEKVLVHNQFTYFYLDGSTDAKERQDLVNEFNDGNRSIFLISLKAGGTGLNLTGADMVIHYDPWWNPAVEEQATDRAYRIGQDKPVQVLRLLTTGTIEEKIDLLQQKKKSLIDNIIQPGETLINKLSEAEIMELFET